MKKIIYFIFLYIISFQSYSYAASGTGNAEVLKVTMKKIELCAGYQGGDFANILTLKVKKMNNNGSFKKRINIYSI